MRALSSAIVFSSSGQLGTSRAGEASRRTLGEVAGDLHLTRQREHVGIEPRGDQHARIDLLRRGMRLGLVENGVELRRACE